MRIVGGNTFCSNATDGSMNAAASTLGGPVAPRNVGAKTGELALKYLIFQARWLKDADTIAEKEEIEDVKNTHNLQQLCDTVMTAIEGKIPKDVLDGYDIDFAKNIVLEFHKVDDKGVRCRYHGEKFGVDKTGAEGARRKLMSEVGWVEVHLRATRGGGQSSCGLPTVAHTLVGKRERRLAERVGFGPRHHLSSRISQRMQRNESYRT